MLERKRGEGRGGQLGGLEDGEEYRLSEFCNACPAKEGKKAGKEGNGSEFGDARDGKSDVLADLAMNRLGKKERAGEGGEFAAIDDGGIKTAW